jgi:hypothetical protein
MGQDVSQLVAELPVLPSRPDIAVLQVIYNYQLDTMEVSAFNMSKSELLTFLQQWTRTLVQEIIDEGI